MASIASTSDLASARRELANLLSYLQHLKKSKHPGRVGLATSLAENILPLLYNDRTGRNPTEQPFGAETDDYPFLEEEVAVINRAAQILGQNIQFLCANDPDHPRHGTSIRLDDIHALFAFSASFKDGFRAIAATIFRRFMRSKRTETLVYNPIREALSDKGDIGIAAHDPQIRKAVTAALSWAQKAYDRAAPEPSSMENRAKPGMEPNKDEMEEKACAVEALERARLHARENGYFLPQSVDYDMLAVLFELDQAVLTQGITELGHAVSQGEGENYVVRQIERLNTSHDLVHFDLAVLSAFLHGEETQRLSFKQLHDTCIGSASSRTVMARVRPLLMAELSRRPHQLARQLVANTEDASVSNDMFQSRVQTFMRWIGSLNSRRFEQEIFGCVSQIWGIKPLSPLVNWIQVDERDEYKVDEVLSEVCTQRAAGL